MSLKELTQEKHTEAEKTEFASLLLSGNISKEQYANYLYQMLLIYNSLELSAKKVGLLDELDDVRRSPNIYKDLIELSGTNHGLTWLPEAVEYHTYLLSLGEANDRNKIMAHIYVRHMGDLYGGQMIKKKVPGSGKFYEFKDPVALKESIRSKLDDSMGDEANVAFDHAIKIMRALG
jgi:heme oxygenase